MCETRQLVDQAPPTVSVEQGAPSIALGSAQTTGTQADGADVTVEQGQANVAVQPSRAMVDVAETEPQVRHNSPEPEIEPEPESAGGTIDKLVNIDDRLYAVVASGGFFDLGSSQTAISLSSLVITGNGLVAPNLTRSPLDSPQDFDGSGYPALAEGEIATIGSL